MTSKRKTDEAAAASEETAPSAPAEEKAAAAEPERQTVIIQGIKIASVGPHGFRRCGRHWPKDGALVAPAEFTEDELRTLNEEQHLVMVPGAPIELGAVSLDELRGWAKIRGIDLGKADTVDAIIERLSLPKASAGAGSNE